MLGGVEVKPVGSSVQKPSNVAVYVAVSDGAEPLDELDESHFRVYENEQLLERAQTQLTLLERERAAYHQLLLLVDLSGKRDEAAQQRLTRALTNFVSSVARQQTVSVFGFDGSTKIWKLGEFQRGHTGEITLERLEASDPSRNLNGAVVQALDKLGAELMRVRRPVRVGTLVVFTSGPDTAGRQSGEALYDAIQASDYDLFALGPHAEDVSHLDEIGRSGKVEAKSPDDLGPAFAEASGLVNRALARYYLVQYCSPARAGTPTLRLEVSTTNESGEQRTGDVELAFDASGFGPGCDPKATPKFSVAARPPWEMEAPDDSERGPRPEQQRGGVKRPPSPPAGPSAPPVEDEDQGDVIVPPPDKPGYE